MERNSTPAPSASKPGSIPRLAGHPETIQHCASGKAGHGQGKRGIDGVPQELQRRVVGWLCSLVLEFGLAISCSSNIHAPSAGKTPHPISENSSAPPNTACHVGLATTSVARGVIDVFRWAFSKPMTIPSVRRAFWWRRSRERSRNESCGNFSDCRFWVFKSGAVGVSENI